MTEARMTKPETQHSCSCSRNRNRWNPFAADTRVRMSYGVAGGRRYTALKD
jgi:hypothetical protein